MTKKLYRTAWLVATLLLGTTTSYAGGICACDCDCDGSGGMCDFTDLACVVGCIGMPPIGACAGADTNCDGVVDAVDAEASACGFALPPDPTVCCQPQFNSAINYQGQLVFGGVPVTGSCDFTFSLWDAPTTPPGAMVGIEQAFSGVALTDGLFEAKINFGRAAYNGYPRWLQVAAICPSGAGAPILLSPRQQLSPTNYAVRAGTGVGGPNGLNVNTRGRVGIGRQPSANSLEVEGNASKTTAGSWLANSDLRIKRDVKSLKDALAVIGRLRPVSFRYTDEFKTKHPYVTDAEYLNYVAQEYQQVFPDAVHDSGDDGLLQLDSHPANVYAIAAIQELHQLLLAKAQAIGDLEARVRELEARIHAQETQRQDSAK